MADQMKDYFFQMGLYYRVFPDGPINYLNDRDVIKIHESGVFLEFRKGCMWFYTGKKKEVVDYIT